MFLQRTRFRGGQGRDPYVPAALATLVAANLGGTKDGFNNAAGWDAGVGGTLSNTAAPAGETVAALHWHDTDVRCYLVINGSGKEAWFTGRQIWINGVGYTCTSAASYLAFTYAIVTTSDIFTAGNSYTVSFVAP